MAVKIRLKRLGKVRDPHYRVVVADSRAKRDGKNIEEIGKYHPTAHPSFIEISSERAQYWLSVGAQPSEQVLALLKLTGDWQKFKGLDGAENTVQTKSASEDFVAPEKGSVIKEKPAKAAEPAAEETPEAAETAEESA